MRSVSMKQNEGIVALRQSSKGVTGMDLRGREGSPWSVAVSILWRGYDKEVMNTQPQLALYPSANTRTPPQRRSLESD